MRPTDTELLDRLADVMPRLIAQRYNWRAATPWTTRIAIALAWEQLCEERAAARDADLCSEQRGRLRCSRRRLHSGAHRYTRAATDPLAGASPPSAVTAVAPPQGAEP